MPIRFYLIPIEETIDPFTGGRARGPKYFAWPRDPDPPALIQNVNAEFRDFGLQPVMLAAADVTNAQHQLLNAQADVTVIPANLDNTVGAAQLANVKAKIEALGIPADQVTANTPYRLIVRGVTAIFALAQRFDGKQGGEIFPPGVTLETQLGDIPATARQKLQDAADELGYDRTGLTLQSTMRDLLKTLANQQMPQTMLGVTI